MRQPFVYGIKFVDFVPNYLFKFIFFFNACASYRIACVRFCVYDIGHRIFHIKIKYLALEGKLGLSMLTVMINTCLMEVMVKELLPDVTAQAMEKWTQYAQELEQDYADVVRRVAAAVKIPVSVKLPMRLTNVLAVADSLLARGARGVVMFNRFFEPDIDVERMAFVNGNPFSEPADLRNVLRSVALCSTALPQLDVAVSTGVHDGEAAVKALLCGANAVQVCSAIHEKGFGVIADINRFIDQWAERHGFESLGEFRGRMDYGNAESDVYQRVQYMKYFPHDAE